MTPISGGIWDILRNFTPVFTENQGKFIPQTPYFYEFEDSFHVTPISRTTGLEMHTF